MQTCSYGCSHIISFYNIQIIYVIETTTNVYVKRYWLSISVFSNGRRKVLVFTLSENRQTEVEQNRCATALAGHRAAILFNYNLFHNRNFIPNINFTPLHPNRTPSSTTRNKRMNLTKCPKLTNRILLPYRHTMRFL